MYMVLVNCNACTCVVRMSRLEHVICDCIILDTMKKRVRCGIHVSCVSSGI